MSTPHTILVVDDDPAAAELAAAVLGDNPEYGIQTAQGAAEALSVAEQWVPELIISDLRMKGESGMDLCRSVRTDPDLRDCMFLMVTGAADLDSRVSAIDAGADDYIAKPVHPMELQAKVRSLLRLKAMREELNVDRRELARLNDALHQQFAGAMKLLVNMIDLRIPGASIRADRACAMADWIGERMGLDGEARKLLTVAARLREIGKTVLPDELLSRPTAELRDEDRSTLDQFPVFGQMLVASIPELKGVEGMLRHQLENFDGSGVPDGLRCGAIPLEARILRAVESLERQLSNGNVLEAGAMMNELQKARGIILDPAVTDLTIEYLGTKRPEGWMESAREIPIDSLEEGMVMAKDVVTSGGMKLLSRGVRLTSSHIQEIRGHHRTDPIMTRCYVQAESGSGSAA